MVNVLVGPGQEVPALAKEGVTVMVATTGEVPVFVAVKEPMSPAPPAARPILVALLAQE